MKYNVVIDPIVYFQMAEAMAFVNNVSHKSAEELYQEIMNNIRSLEEFPYRNPIAEEFKVASMDARRMVVWKGRYSILYTVSKNTVNVECFFDNRRIR